MSSAIREFWTINIRIIFMDMRKHSHNSVRFFEEAVVVMRRKLELLEILKRAHSLVDLV